MGVGLDLTWHVDHCDHHLPPCSPTQPMLHPSPSMATQTGPFGQACVCLCSPCPCYPSLGLCCTCSVPSLTPFPPKHKYNLSLSLSFLFFSPPPFLSPSKRTLERHPHTPHTTLAALSFLLSFPRWYNSVPVVFSLVSANRTKTRTKNKERWEAPLFYGVRLQHPSTPTHKQKQKATWLPLPLLPTNQRERERVAFPILAKSPFSFFFPLSLSLLSSFFSFVSRFRVSFL